jgi:hypothetical protein
VSKLNPPRPASPVSSPIRTVAAFAVTRKAGRIAAAIAAPAPDDVTFQGGPGYRLDKRSALFNLGVSNFVGEATFHESGDSRDERFAALVRDAAVNDGAWFAGFVKWLRHEGNMRDAPIVAVAEAVRARLDAVDDISGNSFIADGVRNRDLISSILVRADEPAKLVAYWASRWGKPTTAPDGRPLLNTRLPKALKRGIGDALPTLWDEYSVFKYDTPGGVRFGDVVEVVHPEDGRHEFYRWLLDRKGGFANDKGRDYPSLPMLGARRVLESVTDPAEKRLFLREVASGDTAAMDAMRDAGVTWEWLASWVGGELDASFWEAVIPRMGYMALLRNLANFDKTGVSDAVAERVAAKLADPAQVARSRQFPYRFLSAYLVGLSARWSYALDKALTASTANLPDLPGRTLVLVDTSASMESTWSEKSKATCVQTAALFGVALAQRNARVDLVGFADGVFSHPVKVHASTLAEINRFTDRIGEVGHGTQIGDAARLSYRGHDRVVLISDMQTGFTGRSSSWDTSRRTIGDVVPANVPIYAFHLGGAPVTAIAAGTRDRHQLGGITDATFNMIKYIESGRQALWPWLEDVDAAR